jgi:hypothetical protein
LRPELLQEPGVSKDFGSYILGQPLKLRFKLVADFDIPSHQSIMSNNTYGIKLISGSKRSPTEGLCEVLDNTAVRAYEAELR